MKFSEQWLREWVNPPVPTDELVVQLTMAGLEVDSVADVAPPFAGVVVGEVLAVASHPDADKLHICQVDVGQASPLNIVCGAPNVHVGMRAPTALIGAELPGGFRIKRAKLRGVPSEGMLCSAAELGLLDDASGLMPLPADARPGADLRDYLQLADRTIDIDLTPNRGDCLGVAGVAREVGVLNRCDVAGVDIAPVTPTIPDTFPVALEAGAQCPRYTGRVIRKIRTGVATPLWMQERLRRSGLRSISPVVDVTNYVLLELGQPMHAFDLNLLEGGIRVRMARPGEPMVLLDGQELTLDEEVLVIADERKAEAIAGVMGGEGSGVVAETTDVFLESAFFEPVAVATRARRYGLHTDSSHRFERGVDPELQVRALERATRLLLDMVGGEPGPVIEAVAPEHLPRRREVTLRSSRITRLLGVEIPGPEVADVLKRLGMGVESTGEGWRVVVPSYRFDIEREADLIEEVGRVYGYSNLPSRSPVAKMVMVKDDEALVPLDRLQQRLAARGYQEAVTYSFVDPKVQALLDPDQATLPLSNPISADLSVMRTTLWSGLVAALRHNQNRQEPDIRLFETGLRFLQRDGQLRQERMLAGMVFGGAVPEQWGENRRRVDFYDVKADVEALLDIGGSRHEFTFRPSAHPALHPGQAAVVEKAGQAVGELGMLHPALEGKLDLSGPVFMFELRVDAVERGALPAFRELSKFPALRRDLAVVVDGKVPAGEVVACVARAAGPILENIRIFDVYRGEGIDPGRKSIALGLTLREPSRTLTDSDVNRTVEQVVSALQGELDATLRE